jgi:hypothetical protein
MAKLADALASGASGREVVQVQVLFRAHNENATLFWRVAFSLGTLVKGTDLKLKRGPSGWKSAFLRRAGFWRDPAS